MNYIVTAYRFGNRERHSYPIGIFSSLKTAYIAGDYEEEYRGGKYKCIIIPAGIDTPISDEETGLTLAEAKIKLDSDT